MYCSRESIRASRSTATAFDLEFARDAEYCNVDVVSKRAGERVLGALRRLFTKLRLRINESKSAVARPQDRKFLGYSFWYAKGSEVKRRIASKALVAMKDRVRV